MSLIQAAILGIVEGLTEFLPISSTAHLILTSNFLSIPQTEFTKFFDVLVQSGAIAAVIILYGRYLLNNRSLLQKVMISFIPTAIVGLIFHKMIKTVFFESEGLIIGSFLMVGLVFLFVEYLVKNKTIQLERTIEKISVTDAFLIGLFQSLAIVPGVSRAGAVIVTMMILKYKRRDAALYSFLLAVPTILGAGILDALKTDPSIILVDNNLLILTVGFAVSFASAIIVIKWFIGFLQKNTLLPFAVYRVILAILLLSL